MTGEVMKAEQPVGEQDDEIDEGGERRSAGGGVRAGNVTGESV